MTIKIGILTVSDRAARGEYKDQSGPIIADIIGRQTEWKISHRAIVGDEIDEIVSILKLWGDEDLDLVLTTGGTGFAPRDVTPEATLEVIERQTPGIAEALRHESLKITRHAMLSRAVAGIRRGTLIINLPGSPKAVTENLEILLPVLPHAFKLLQDRPEAESDHRSI